MANGDTSVSSSKKLGGGGTAKVYKVPAGAFPVPIAIKRYSDKILAKDGAAIGSYLRSLIEFRKNLPDDMRRIIDNFALLPQRLVYDNDNDKVCGFTMQLIPPIFFEKIKVAGEDEIKESNLDFVLHGADFRRKHGLPPVSAKGRAKIIHDFMQIVLILHNHDYVLGDLSPKNILISIDERDQSKNRILFIDTDSYRKKGSIHPLKQLHTPDWIPLECQKASDELSKLTPNANPNLIARLEVDMFIQNQCTDVYKLCLAIMRLYHEGDHSSIITESESADKKLRKDIGEEFADYILLGLSDKPDERPFVSTLRTCFKNSMLAKQKKGSK
jgi:serine/threonine protein kinase